MSKQRGTTHNPMLPLIEAFKKDLYHCSDCNYCVDAVWAERGIDHVCATMEHHTPVTSYSGRGYIAAARAWLEGAELDLDALGVRAFTCTTCGNCEHVCPIGLHPTAVGRALRGELWARQRVPPAITALHARMIKDGNPNGVPREARMTWAFPRSVESATAVLYLPGCAAATVCPVEAQAACALIAAAGYQVTTLGNADTCCGAPLHELGCDDEAGFMFDSLSSKAAPSTTIVMSGLECARRWHGAARAHSPLSFVTWLATSVREGRLTFRRNGNAPTKVHVLDSCQSRSGVTTNADLREILRAVGVGYSPPLKDARHIVCCGAAGGMPQMQPESAARMALARIQVGAGEAEIFVSADPRCVAHVRSAMHDSKPRVFGLAEFITTYFSIAA